MSDDLWSRIGIGMMIGLSQTYLFNPVDRALYLHIKERRPFLNVKNWKTPFQGVSNAVVSRVFNYGVYFALKDTFQEKNRDLTSRPWVNSAVAGMELGTMSAIILNPLAAIKYQGWGQETRSLFHISREMWRDAGAKAYVRGLRSVITRDNVFSVPYVIAQNHLKTHYPELKKQPLKMFGVNCAIVSVAATLSSPFNYIRNRRYSVPFNKPAPSWKMIVQRLMKETRVLPTRYERVRYLQARLCIGWGTLRVAVGISLGQIAYDYLTQILSIDRT